MSSTDLAVFIYLVFIPYYEITILILVQTFAIRFSCRVILIEYVC